MEIGYLLPCLSAILSGACIFAFCRQLHNFQKFVGFTFIFEGLSLLLGGSVLSPGAAFYLPTYLLYMTMMLAVPFFYYFSVKYLLKENGVKGRDFWMLILVAVYIVTVGVTVLYIPSADRNAFLLRIQGLGSGKLSAASSIMLAQDTLAYVLCIVEYLFILAFCAINIFRYRGLLSRYYSNPNAPRSAEIIVLVVSLRLLLMILSLFVSGAGPDSWAFRAQNAVGVLFYIIAAAYICRVEHTAEELSILLESREQKAMPKTPAADEVISTRLWKLIESRFYLNPQVTLMDLSNEIKVNSKYVSEYLRFHYGETFLVFVNRLRIEFSETLLKDSDTSIADIAEQCGYTSVSTFYRNFTKMRGMNPSEYRAGKKKSCN